MTTSFLDVAWPTCRARWAAELDTAMARVLDCGPFVLGPAVEQFEAAVRPFCGVPHAVGVASGTDAITIAPAGRRRRARRRGDHRREHVRPDRRGDRGSGRDARVRRRRRRHTHDRPSTARGGRHIPHAGDRPGPPVRQCADMDADRRARAASTGCRSSRTARRPTARGTAGRRAGSLGDAAASASTPRRTSGRSATAARS